MLLVHSVYPSTQATLLQILVQTILKLKKKYAVASYVHSVSPSTQATLLQILVQPI